MCESAFHSRTAPNYYIEIKPERKKTKTKEQQQQTPATQTNKNTKNAQKASLVAEVLFLLFLQTKLSREAAITNRLVCLRKKKKNNGCSWNGYSKTRLDTLWCLNNVVFLIVIALT